MKREERISHISNMLKRFVSEGDPKSFLFFENPASGKDVQIAWTTVFPVQKKRKELECTIGYMHSTDLEDEVFTTEEENEAKAIFDEVGREGDPEGEYVSTVFRKRFHVDEIDKATEFVERIFINVFKLPESYVITSRIVKPRPIEFRRRF